MKKIFTIAAMLTVAFCAMAQPQGEGQPPRQRGNRAQMKADRMKQELALTDKQYKKVLKVFKDEESAMHPESSRSAPSSSERSRRPASCGPSATSASV